IYIVAIPIVSLGMIVILANEYNKEEHKWIQVLFITGAVGELIGIASLVILDSAMLHGLNVEFYKNILILIFIFVIAFYLFRFFGLVLWWFPELRKIIMPENDRMSQDIRVSITLFFVLIGVMQYHGIDMVLGAFISGVFIANFFRHKETLPETLNKVGFGFLVPLFFIYVGTTIDLAVVMKLEIIFQALWIVVAMVGLRIISGFIAYYKYLGARDTILFAFGYSMPLTFLVAIATIAVETGAIALHDYYAFVLAAMIEAVFIMILIQFIMSKISPKS
ncbi:MAG TPA: cation:proton antiporter, partial [Epsilonproteobacteria bacterium]|nr:cation:proton antiporter [Campylobacterota bacterium]